MEQTALNIDCMEYMSALPDNAFDLAIVDPPYGDGTTLGAERERERENVPRWNRFGHRFDRYKEPLEQGGHGLQSTAKKL